MKINKYDVFISNELFKSLTKITLDNIGTNFGYDVIFFVIDIIKVKYRLVNSFPVRKIFVKGYNKCVMFYGNGFNEYKFLVREPESQNDYNDSLDSIKNLIKMHIKDGRLFSRRI